jgi:hypothetical protein
MKGNIKKKLKLKKKDKKKEEKVVRRSLGLRKK